MHKQPLDFSSVSHVRSSLYLTVLQRKNSNVFPCIAIEFYETESFEVRCKLVPIRKHYVRIWDTLR